MECVAHLHSTACTGLPALSVQPRTGIVVYRGEQNVYRGEQKAYHVDEPPPKRLQRQQAAATPVATEGAAGLRRTKSSLNRAPTEKVKDESDAVSLEAATQTSAQAQTPVEGRALEPVASHEPQPQPAAEVEEGRIQ